ncbi:MAG: TCP-1/cpn60 chaperonin family protein [Candidatus Lokiarchaeota archaeon]|nr:TCP-1/cpn60 chaperonin family protein [Candidatus Lokiarchaeota archaeon]
MKISLSGQPVLLLKEGSERQQGKNAQQNNIAAAKVIAEAVRTSLGPRGMDKMLVDQFGDVTITNDGATILKEIDVQHPAAKMIVEVAKTQDDEVGDGTTSAVVLAGELLKRAGKLLEQKIHPTIITEGFQKAAEKALEILDAIGTKVDPKDQNILRQAAITSMSSKVVNDSKHRIADIAVKAALSVVEEKDGTLFVDLDKIQIQKKEGESVEDTQLISGIILDKEVVNPSMKKRVENAKILLLQEALEIKKTEFDAKLSITSPDQIQSFLDQEEQMLKDMVDKIVATGANVVICQKGIDDLVQHFLAKKGISAVRRVKKSDLEKLSKATGGTIFTSFEGLDKTKLGKAGLFEERKVMKEDWVFVEDCKDPRALSILIRGGTELVVEEADRAIHDALCVVKDIIEQPAVIGGGGAPEAEVAKQLREYAESLSGREQLAVKVFADSLDIIPKTLAENAGFDQIDMLMQLRASHASHVNSGIDPELGVVDDLLSAGVIEPIVVKKQAIKSASEAAQMILRIDDIISAGANSGGPPGMPPGGGMY